ncbi:MAG TPA: HEPN domain-containing protein [Mucilaginibacter sp.]|jgi:HEPN domain-containing protein
MYNGTYAPWEHYPKTLRHYEVENPISVIAEFFSTDSVNGHSRQLKVWRRYVVNNESYNDKDHGPGTLLFIYDMNLKILKAMFLLLCNYKNFSYRRETIGEGQLELEKQQWEYFPENLSKEEQLDPYKAVKKVFKKIKPQQYRDYLHEWVHAALYNTADNENLYAGEVITVYENLLKLYAAAWLIHQREGGKPELKQNRPESRLPGIPVELRAINPNPTETEIDVLEMLKNLILKKCPSVRMIVHLGVHPEPFTFYLVVLVSDDEKIPEHQISNKIEDNCHYICFTHAIVHKANSAKEALETGNRFWSMVMEKGFVVYQSNELILPERREITSGTKLEEAKFNWERWGVQGNDFLKGAEFYRPGNNLRLAAFLLHQAVEGTLKGIIQAILGYRVQTHNLSRLLSLTLLFTDDLKKVFKLDTEEGFELFSLLQKSYSQSRYNNVFDPDEESVNILFQRVAAFYKVAETIIKQCISSLQSPVS